jgi:hypothetical protein
VTLVVAALAAGAGAGVSDVASSAVTGAFEKLKGLVVGRFRQGGRSADGAVLDRCPLSKDDEAQLREALTVVEVDEPTGQAAQELLDLVKKAKAGKFVTDASHAKGVQIGDHGTLNATFNG